MKFENPYAGDRWLRGNLHTHTTNSDGKREPQVVIDDYSKRGYDFLMISDHDFITDVTKLDPRDLVLISGNEITAHGPHVLHVNPSSKITPDPNRQFVLDQIREEPGGFAILAHPNWHRSFDHYKQNELESLKGHLGIEIYNGVIERLPGSPIATDRWDQLLGKGIRTWGFANDDSHMANDVELGWNVVRATDKSVEAILGGFRCGSFYASTGVTIDEISVIGSQFRMKSAKPAKWKVVGEFGRVLDTAVGRSFAWRAQDDLRGYVRFEAAGDLGSMAWTQPFFKLK